MDHCIYSVAHGNAPNCKGACKTGLGEHCPYYFTDEFWHKMSDWKREAKIDTPVLYRFDNEQQKLYIYTTKPGYMIGKYGSLVEKYKLLLKEATLFNNKIENGIEFVECQDCVA